MIGFSTFLLGCIDYSKLRHEDVTHLSQVIVHECVSKCVPPSYHERMYIYTISSQIPRTNTSLFHPLPRILHLANHLIHTRHPPSHRHVQVLHLFTQDTRRTSLLNDPPSSPAQPLSRLTFKLSPGRKLSAASARFVKKIP